MTSRMSKARRGVIGTPGIPYAFTVGSTLTDGPSETGTGSP
jgi:hypothetical protein